MKLLAVWLLSQWLNFGKSKPIKLVELGPGRGTLMADILRVRPRTQCHCCYGTHVEL